MDFAVYSRPDSHSHEIASGIEEKLIHSGWKKNLENPCFVICVGGDGTLLRAIHEYMEQLDTIYFTAIHTGTLGFFTDYTDDQIDELVFDLLSQKYKVDACRLLSASLDDGRQFYALNEIRLGDFTSTVRYQIYINDEFFEQTNGNGICICTQSGSSAVNRSLGGAVVDGGLNVMEMTEIMPVSNNKNHSLISPYIMREDRKIRIESTCFTQSVLCYDQLESRDLQNVKYMIVQMSDRFVQFARFKPYSYLKRLRSLY